MSEEKRKLRRAQAEDARTRGANPNQYSRREAQSNTVGFLTTMAGSMAAGYEMGWLTEHLGATRINLSRRVQML